MRHASWMGLAWLMAISLLACGPQAPASPRANDAAAADRAIQDMAGRTVSLPRTLSRVATIDDGFVESVMTRLGTIRTLVAVGSSSQQRTWSYTYPTAGGRESRADGGMGTLRSLHPWIAELPCASRTSGDPINFETLASARPELVILRTGDCTIGDTPETVTRTIAVLESMRMRVVVLRSPTDPAGTGDEAIREEILLLGKVFAREREATELAEEISGVERFIESRTADAPDAARPRVLLLGLAARARSSGGAGYAWGRETAESLMLETIVGARNAYTGPGARVLLSAEQVLALDPDVIVLPTASGYHPPSELAEAPYFSELQRLRAVRERRVYALPWSPMNCARRLEYPIDLMIVAKASFPQRFGDTSVSEWILDFYRRTYLVDDARARQLRRGQWLEWTAESRF